MKTNEKYDVLKSVRLTRTQVNQLDKLNATIRDAVIFYIEHMTNSQLKLIDKRRELEKHIHEKEFELKQLDDELQQINKEIAIVNEVETTVNLDIVLDGNKIIESFKKWRTNKNQTINNYFATMQFEKLLEQCVAEHGSDTPRTYEEILIKYILNNVGE